MHHFCFGLSESLKKINYAPAIAVHLGFEAKAIKFKERAFGILSRNEENVPFLGVLFNSHFFPHSAPKGKELITVICGGARYPKIVSKTDEDVLKEITSCITKLLGISKSFDFTHIQRWEKGIPQYELGYKAIEADIDLFLGCLLYTSPSPRD